jgi:hypothetical protein
MGLNLNWLVGGSGDMLRPETVQAPLQATAPLGHHDVVPGYCRVRDREGVQMTRIDLLPDLMAPALEWISRGIAVARDQIDWDWASKQLIARYEWDFMTWLNEKDTASRPTTPGGGSWS